MSSTVTKPLFLNETGERIADALEIIAVASAKDIDITDAREIQELVRAGKAEEFFSLGDQIDVIWKPDNSSDTTYHIPFDVVAFLPVVDDHDVTHEHAMWLQSHYALTGIQFSGNNAFYVPSAALPAGTYNFTMANAWGNNVVKDKVYQFTTTSEIPAGGQLILGTASSNTSGLPDTAPANWRVRTYSTATQADPTETLELTEGSGGTDLGSLSSSQKYSTSGINNMQRSAYGYNRYAHSAIRQWLNSSAGKGEWWEPKNPFDHRPDQFASVQGFMAGLPQDFLQIIKPIKITTALNTVSDVDIGESEDVYDRFFLPSVEQEYGSPQASGVEGSYWPYWKQRLQIDSPSNATNARHIRYAYENHTSAQYVRLRSAYRGYAHSAWSVTTSGYVGTYNATSAFRPVPACVIY